MPPTVIPILLKKKYTCAKILFENIQCICVFHTFNVAKCNLGKVNLEATLASSFPNNNRGGPMLLVGAPRG